LEKKGKIRRRIEHTPCVLVTHDRDEAALLDAMVVAMLDGGFS
jgi:ABC-type proline/glycine betaine transport system ATPase subunit